MVDSINLDSSQIVGLVGSLATAPRASADFIRLAVVVSAHKVRDSWRQKATGDPHAPAYPYSITYDVEGGLGIRGSEITAEIGPDKDRAQGALGNLKEFGSVNNAPRGYGAAALQETEADFVEGLGKAVDDGLRSAGL